MKRVLPAAGKTVWLALALCLTFAGCETPFRTLKSTERAILFNRLPAFLGGGLREEILQPGKVVTWPWQEVFVIDLGEKPLEFREDEALDVRTADGRKAAVPAALRFRVPEKAEAIVLFVKTLGARTAQANVFVAAELRGAASLEAARLSGYELLDANKKQDFENRVKEVLRERLREHGVQLAALRFETPVFRQSDTAQSGERRAELRKIEDETAAAQAELRRVQAGNQQALGELQQELQRRRQQAEAEKKSVMLKADNYFKIRESEAKSMLKSGMMEVQALSERLQAYAGPGGRALLKLEIAEELLKSEAEYAVAGSGGGQIINDTGKMLEQLGVGPAKKAAKGRTEKPSHPVSSTAPLSGDETPRGNTGRSRVRGTYSAQ